MQEAGSRRQAVRLRRTDLLPPASCELSMSLGLYISIPFCRSKCSYCNFASGVFPRPQMESYTTRLCRQIENAGSIAAGVGGRFERAADTLYWGGGTPSLLEPAQFERVLAALRTAFDITGDAEFTVECAPGTLSPAMVETLAHCGVNRVSLGIQSFEDKEAAAVGRLHNRQIVLDDLKRLRRAGIANINLDLIAGLPHQTRQSWSFSLAQTVEAGVPHVSVYMLEVDEDSRLGRELLAGGIRYHAHFAPDQDVTAEFYEQACGELESAGMAQYEISNFSRPGCESRHNLKYWTRQPYFGFGLDAHSMLPATDPQVEAVRFAWPDTLDAFTAAEMPAVERISPWAALEETFFLGLRLNGGVSLRYVENCFGANAVGGFASTIEELIEAALLEPDETMLRLTPRGRLLANEVFQHFVSLQEAVSARRP